MHRSNLPPLTLLIGPQTTVSLAVNNLVRQHRRSLAKAGITALPARLSSPILRRAINERPAEERRAEFIKATAQHPMLLCALNFFGPPHAGPAQREIFPKAEKFLDRLADVASGARVVMAIDRLPAFYLAARSAPLEARLRKTPWEVLYELGWLDLARKIRSALPTGTLTVLTPESPGRFAPDTLRSLFGDENVVPDQHVLARHSVSETGRGVLDRLIANGDPDADTLNEFYTSFALRSTPGEAREKLGIDKVTYELLEQRFDEDLRALRQMPRTKVLG